MRSGPTSSASQASSAPLLNVQPKPMSAAAARTTPTSANGACEDEAGAHDELGDDDGDAPAVEVGDDPVGTSKTK